MQNFINDFNIFFNSIFNSLISFMNFYLGTVLGKITIFCILILLFYVIIDKINDMKD